ncbi:S-adenosyl-L-methionine-dependent methyltransferase [Blastocladiella britannica]|nr:S-adenosyl-L-methionine-dependent methyltransferase [Blastocladiella britannica]
MATSTFNGADGNDRDAAIRATDDDAALARLSAVQCGYLVDRYAAAFVHARHPPRRPPLINRGTYARITAFDRVLGHWLSVLASTSTSGPAQVVSLGAGTDTRYLRFAERAANADNNDGDMAAAVWARVRYFEVDLPKTVLRKVSAMRKAARTTMGPQLLPDPAFDAKTTTYTAGALTITAGDLRDWPTVPRRLAELGFDPRLPTLVMAECVLVYVDPPSAVDTMLQWIAATCRDVVVASYDHIQPEDAFGRMMVANLRSRGIELPGLHAFPSLDAHQRRYLENGGAGFTSAQVWDMNGVWRDWVSEDEKERIAKLEMLDEVEELQLLFAHYCLSIAARGPIGSEVVKLGGT